MLQRRTRWFNFMKACFRKIFNIVPKIALKNATWCALFAPVRVLNMFIGRKENSESLVGLSRCHLVLRQSTIKLNEELWHQFTNTRRLKGYHFRPAVETFDQALQPLQAIFLQVIPTVSSVNWGEQVSACFWKIIGLEINYFGVNLVFGKSRRTLDVQKLLEVGFKVCRCWWRFWLLCATSILDKKVLKPNDLRHDLPVVAIKVRAAYDNSQSILKF